MKTRIDTKHEEDLFWLAMDGLAAGLLATAVMTASQLLEMQITGRESSRSPAKAAEKMFGLKPSSDAEQNRLSWAVHWSWGTAVGLYRPALELLGFTGRPAAVLHFIVLWTADNALLYRLGLAKAPWDWKREELATDLFHKAIFVIASHLVYEAARAPSRRRYR